MYSESSGLESVLKIFIKIPRFHLPGPQDRAGYVEQWSKRTSKVAQGLQSQGCHSLHPGSYELLRGRKREWHHDPVASAQVMMTTKEVVSTMEIS